MMRKIMLAVSLLIVGAVAVITAVACVLMGTRAGLTVGLIALFILGGGEALWDLLTHRLHRRMSADLEEERQARFERSTEDNPTVR